MTLTSLGRTNRRAAATTGTTATIPVPFARVLFNVFSAPSENLALIWTALVFDAFNVAPRHSPADGY
jgi:hypothetical protein